MKGLISCSVACRFYDIPTGKCRLGCEEKADPNADFYDDCPLPDVVEVKHGKWIGIRPYEGSEVWYYQCSECGHYESLIKRPYCAGCGAQMDGMDGGENDGN